MHIHKLDIKNEVKSKIYNLHRQKRGYIYIVGLGKQHFHKLERNQVLREAKKKKWRIYIE